MNIISAIKSGKRFTHPNRSILESSEVIHVDRWIRSNQDCYSFTREEILSEEWIIEEEKIEITRSQLSDAWIKSVWRDDKKGSFELFLMELGFK